jgi:hypothetical protein
VSHEQRSPGPLGLKWNPFLPELPSEALFISPRIEHFGFHLEGKVREGGFALITGAPGTGKSVSLRILADRLSGLRTVTVGVVSHPQSGVSDIYRELGDLFGVPLARRNRWAASSPCVRSGSKPLTGGVIAARPRMREIGVDGNDPAKTRRAWTSRQGRPPVHEFARGAAIGLGSQPSSWNLTRLARA